MPHDANRVDRRARRSARDLDRGPGGGSGHPDRGSGDANHRTPAQAEAEQRRGGEAKELERRQRAHEPGP